MRFWRKHKKTNSFDIFKFDFSKIADVDDHTVKAFMNTTHTAARRMPLLIAGYVAHELETNFLNLPKTDALQMAEYRGAMRALKMFAHYYLTGINDWIEKNTKPHGTD